MLIDSPINTLVKTAYAAMPIAKHMNLPGQTSPKCSYANLVPKIMV